MEGTVKLEIQEYNELYTKAVQGQELEREYMQLKEELAIARKQLEELQQPDENDSYVIVQDKDDSTKSVLLCGKYIYSTKDVESVRHIGMIKESSLHEQNEECSEEDEKDVVTVNGKSVKDILKENEMLHKMGVFKHYAKGGVTTKSELTDQSPFPMLKRSKKNK